MTSTLEYRSEPNASILLHELRTAESQMLSIRAGLEHIAENAEHRIIYLVDYPEINAFWQSKLPNHVHQLGDDGVRTIWNYLTGLEQVMSLLDYKLDEALTLLQRSYFEQAEYLESLLLNQRFFTLIAPPAWRQLEDDLIYLNRFQGDTAGNWQSAINQNEQKLLHDYSSPNEVTEHGYWGDVENFGFASLSRDKTSNLAKIVGSFVTRANFQDAEDDCWAQVSDDAQVAKHIASEIADFRPDEPHEKWTELLDEGNKLYNIAFGRSGNWRRRQDGAATLAYLYHINKVLARHAPHIKVAFVTRNHQYHHLMQAWDKQDSAADQRPLIFHPHSLIAFMIRQSGDVDFEVRSASAINIIKSIDDLLGTFRIVRQFVQEIAGSPGVGVSLPLRNYVVKRLGSGLAEFRKSSLAERVQPRIIDRKPMWSKGPNKRIAALLNKVADFRLKTTQWHRELSLLRTLPPVVELGSDVKLIYIELKERERGTAVLIGTSSFSHPFKFFSAMVEQQLRRTSNNQDASIVELVESARVIAEGSFERWAQTYKNAASESDFLERELQVLQIRFDLLLMFAILLADKALFEQSLDALQLAISIYEKGDGKPAASEAKGYALNEALYLEGIVRRLMWRKDIESLKAQERLDSGNRRLQDHIRKINELLGENGRRGKRLRVFLVAFQRELRGFATRNNLQPEGIWPISLQGALETLQQVIQESLNERAQFHYVTLRACQHWLAYSRMLEHSQIGPNNDIGALPRSQQIEVFKAFKLELDKLRRDLERLGADRHYSIFVTELSGMIKFQLELDFSRKDIANALSFLENLNCPDNRLGLSQNAAQVKAEARTLLER